MIAVCIPARNEQASICQLVWQLKQRGYFPIVSDDASTDQTARLAEAAGAVVVRHTHPVGIAGATIDAWQAALVNGAGAIVQMDAGGSHSVSDIPGLVGLLEDHQVVIGSRFCDSGRYIGGSVIRRTLSKMVTAYCNMRTGAHVTDWTSGMRSFRPEICRFLAVYPYKARMHSWQIEVLRESLHAFMIGEVPITYTAGRSSMRVKQWPEIIHTLTSLGKYERKRVSRAIQDSTGEL